MATKTNNIVHVMCTVYVNDIAVNSTAATTTITTISPSAWHSNFVKNFANKWINEVWAGLRISSTYLHVNKAFDFGLGSVLKLRDTHRHLESGGMKSENIIHQEDTIYMDVCVCVCVLRMPHINIKLNGPLTSKTF